MPARWCIVHAHARCSWLKAQGALVPRRLKAQISGAQALLVVAISCWTGVPSARFNKTSYYTMHAKRYTLHIRTVHEPTTTTMVLQPNRFTRHRTSARRRSPAHQRFPIVLPTLRDPSPQLVLLRRHARSRPPPPPIPVMTSTPFPNSPTLPDLSPEGFWDETPVIRPAAATARKSAPPTSPVLYGSIGSHLACPVFGSAVFPRSLVNLPPPSSHHLSPPATQTRRH